MKHPVLCAIFACCFASTAFADPCVGATFDQPFPDARDVRSFVSDVPSAQYPAFWQRGFLNDYTYVMLANGEAELRSTRPFDEWVVTVRCDSATQACAFSRDGSPPLDTANIADRLGACLLGNSLTPAALAPMNITEPIAATCGLATVNEATDIATLQRLLVIADKDPGPIDGLLGPQTFQALDGFVENAGWDMSVSDAIAHVDAALCQGLLH